MTDDKIFDVKKVKVDISSKDQQQVEEAKPSTIKLHVRYFDWHTIAYILYGLAIILAFVAASLTTRYFIVKKEASDSKPAQDKIVESSTKDVTETETKTVGENPFAPPETPKEEEIDKKAIKIRVLNGNGITGDGAKAKKELEDAGFTVSEVGNAKRQDYTTTQVYYIADKKAQAQLVGKALKSAGRETALEEASTDLVGTDTEILVVTGKK